ncbi:MAG: COX15/CtaA family protein [Aquitalea sp.]|nr:COX15/CtaA family protein [Aquitalea sp.]
MRKLLWLALLLACVLLPLGAYVRLSQAGLGCPDWPGCYGQISPAHAADAIAQAMQLQPDGPVSPDKAWKEMLHRYLAGSLGLLVLLYALQVWRHAQARRGAGLLLGLLLVQALLGRLTVTLQLQPWVVTAHLLLGMSLVALLLWQASARDWPSQPVAASGLWLSRLLLLLVLGQILLGGWVSSHQAALACQGFPSCNGSWWPPLAEGGPVAMHWLHRLGALTLLTVLLLVVWRLWPNRALRRHLRFLLLLGLLQVVLGMGTVLWLRPLPLALAHHIGAMALLAGSLALAGRLRGMPVRRCLRRAAVGRPPGWSLAGRLMSHRH